jgi:hypothetical protein
MMQKSLTLTTSLQQPSHRPTFLGSISACEEMEASLGQTAVPSLAPTIVENFEQDDTKTIAPEVSSLAQLPSIQKNVLLAIFCLGQFLDIMNTSAMLPALPATSKTVGLTESDSVWLFAAYQATFAGFLLIVSSLHFILLG